MAAPTITKDQILSGDRRALARAATLVENRAGRDLLRELFPHTGRAFVLGITGAPGAGKSTLTDQIVRLLRANGQTAAVIAVDPTSSFSGGAILGDRIRMLAHHADPGVFIRSMATRGHLGGLAPATAEMADLFDAAGFEVVIVETVGVGQDEVEIARLAHATLVVLTPGAGDDVQTLKAGIMEIADVFVLNKSDLPGADKLEREILGSLSLAKRADGWVPPVIPAIAQQGKGVEEALAAARKYRESGRSAEQAHGLWASRMREMLRERLLEQFPNEMFMDAAGAVASRKEDPYTIVERWLERARGPA